MSLCARNRDVSAYLIKEERKREKAYLSNKFPFEIDVSAISGGVQCPLTFGDEEIHDGQCNRVPAKHVVSARPHTLHRHAESTPNGVCTGDTPQHRLADG